MLLLLNLIDNLDLACLTLLMLLQPFVVADKIKLQ
jgi:hypothetical protein